MTGEVVTRRPAGLWTAIVGIALATGCATEAPTRELPSALVWVQRAAEYRALTRQTYAAAAARLDELTRDLEPGTWAVAIDADETVLDNSNYQLGRARLGARFTQESWLAWCRQREAGAVPGAVEFLQRVRARGGRIAIVSNRSVEVQADTEANLRAAGAPFDVVLLRGADREKEPRWQQIERGTAAPGLPPLRIAMWVGDAITDFPDLDPQVEHRRRESREEFGRRWFLLPNPMYGSWERIGDG